MTLDKAKTLHCPFSKTGLSILESSSNRCLGDKCMAWKVGAEYTVLRTFRTLDRDDPRITQNTVRVDRDYTRSNHGLIYEFEVRQAIESPEGSCSLLKDN